MCPSRFSRFSRPSRTKTIRVGSPKETNNQARAPLESPGGVALTDVMAGWITDIGKEGPEIRKMVSSIREKYSDTQPFKGQWSTMLVTPNLLRSTLPLRFSAPELIRVLILVDPAECDSTHLKLMIEKYINLDHIFIYPRSSSGIFIDERDFHLRNLSVRTSHTQNRSVRTSHARNPHKHLYNNDEVYVRSRDDTREWTMVFFPSLNDARKILSFFQDEEDFFEPGNALGDIFGIPVFLTLNRDLAVHAIASMWNGSGTCCMLSTVGPDYEFPITIYKNTKTWLKNFTDGPFELLELLTHDLPEVDTNGRLILREPLNESDWEKIRMIYFSLQKRPPILPSFYPANIYL